ncbi:hypothetical protein EJ04DRAFT_502298 [Polyplosphaeria fusca]|uniref:Cell wall protein n=1 Tax=Polyplosphaeria fusca TaxID=682080 RepID=A0A9P4UYR2_9PLEO|nr:hypothetical protein EJ04DRAFT_502298 [Polyplosphaeria fusca]
MKTSTLAILASVLSTIAAAPTRLAPRQDGIPSTQEVANAINKWHSDVSTVNSFLDNIGDFSSSKIIQQAQATLDAVNDEPKQLAVLEALTDTNLGTAGQAAADRLKTTDNFGGIKSALENIILVEHTSPGVDLEDPLASINQIRCCGVLNDIDLVWSAAAFSSGIGDQVPTAAPKPKPCETFSCA